MVPASHYQKFTTCWEIANPEENKPHTRVFSIFDESRNHRIHTNDDKSTIWSTFFQRLFQKNLTLNEMVSSKDSTYTSFRLWDLLITLLKSVKSVSQVSQSVWIMHSQYKCNNGCRQNVDGRRKKEAIHPETREHLKCIVFVHHPPSLLQLWSHHFHLAPQKIQVGKKMILHAFILRGGICSCSPIYY